MDLDLIDEIAAERGHRVEVTERGYAIVAKDGRERAELYRSERGQWWVEFGDSGRIVRLRGADWLREQLDQEADA